MKRLGPHWPLRVCGTLLAWLLVLGGEPLRAQEHFWPQYDCRSLPEVLEDLESRGLRLVYDDELVTADMLVRQSPPRNIPRTILEQILEQHDLAVAPREDGRLEIVPGPGMSHETIEVIRASARNWQVLKRQGSPGVLPNWVSRDTAADSLAEISFTRAGAAAVSLDPSTRYLVVRLHDIDFDDWTLAAFDLKQIIVDAGAVAPGVRIGVEGSPRTIERLIDEELAPYVDGYVYEAEPFIPAQDPTGRPWWRIEVDESEVLTSLLEADRARAEVVIFSRAVLDEQHESFLRRIQRMRGAYLDQQPTVLGIEQDRVRFFLDPDIGHYYLAVYATPDEPQDIRFGLEPDIEVRPFFPSDASFAWDSYGRRVEVLLDGSEPYYLFELAPGRVEPRRTRLLVEDEVIVDPYEVVVRNQIFQEREREKFRSLDVMEYIAQTPHWIGGDQIEWEHRLIQRKGKLTDYHHLNVWINGVHYPHNKMRKGPLNRPAAQIELEPLEVELDKTYQYTYLGQEEIGGHPTWKIGFKPIAKGRYLSGVVWIDQRTGAHRRMRTSHKAYGGFTMSRNYTTHYEWISSNGNCFWDWRLRRGVEVYDYLNFQGTSEFQERREGFEYNRVDIEEEVRRAYESDIMIHVETPPQGHRWLVKTEGGKRVKGGQLYSSAGRFEDSLEPSQSSPGAGIASSEASSGVSTGESESDPPESDSAGQPGEPVPLTSDRVMAGLHAFAKSSRVSFGASTSSNADEADAFAGISFSDLSFAGRDWYFSIGAFDDEGLVAFTNPSLFGTKWSFTTAFAFSTSPEEDFAFRQIEDEAEGDENSFQDLSIDTQRMTLSSSVSYPISGTLTGRVGYGLSRLDFEDKKTTDPAFVLPTDTLEHMLRSELNYHRRNFTVELRIDYGYRADWEPWGIDGAEELHQDFWRGLARATLTKRLTRSQMIGGRLAYIDGVDTDRFSRYRLFQVDARVPGYSSSIGFDQTTAAELFYNFRIWKLPFRYRLDASDYSLDDNPVSQRLVGHQFNLFLNGPLKTDWFFGYGRGLDAKPDRGPNVSVAWIVVSRRFGG